MPFQDLSLVPPYRIMKDIDVNANGVRQNITQMINGGTLLYGVEVKFLF